MIQMLLHMLPLVSLLFLLPLLFFIHFLKPSSSKEKNPNIPNQYPLVGSYLARRSNKHRHVQWLSDIVLSSPASTFNLHGLLGRRAIITGNPATLQHILKTHFSNYQKGSVFVGTLHDFLGTGIFNSNGDTWKFQRQIASHEFNTKSLRKFVENVVDSELLDRLVPIFSSAAAEEQTIDFQDVLQRFAFDNICRIAFGFDPEYLKLSSSSERSKFAQAFEDATEVSSERFREALPIVWKMKRILNIGSEKRLRIAVSEVREFAKKLVREKKMELQSQQQKEENASLDMLSRFLNSGHSDDDFVTDMVISFILAGKDTTSAALTWFFWLLSKNPLVEEEVLKEINHQKSEGAVYDKMKEMVYTHAALCESMRLYPPVPTDSKEAVNDDVLPDGTVMKKGMMVTYHVYAMGRMESIWGDDWAEFRPERWLERVEDKWSFVGRDSYSYPVFQAGPRICLGKEMAFLQMKMIVAGVLRRFKVVPTAEESVEPEFISFLTSQMKGGFPVKIVERKRLSAI